MICFIGVLMIRAKKYGQTYEEYVEQAHIINNFVLPNGLEEKELNTAIRQEEWEKLNISNEKQLYFDMAEDVINYWNCLWANQKVAFFNHNENRYDTDEIVLKGYLLEKYQYENITTSKIEEVLKQVNIQLITNHNYWKERNNEYVLCKDKLVSVTKDEVIPNTRSIYTDIYYPYEIMTQEEFNNFNGRAKSFMEEISCYDKEKNPNVLKIIWQCIGCMLAPTKPFGKIFIWYGTGANGKSLLLKLLKKIMGNLMTHANILNINDNFALQNVHKGIANVTDDVGITTLKETGIFKSLIDGLDIEVNIKHRDPIVWKPNSQFVMCCNEIPRIEDTTEGMFRRISFVPFEMHIPKEKRDIKLESILSNDIDNLRYIMSGGIFAYREALKNGSLTEIQKQKDLLNDFLEENKDSISLFYDFLVEREGGLDGLCKWIDGKLFNDVFTEYDRFVEIDNNISKRKFLINFNRKLPSRVKKQKQTIAGITYDIYVVN